MERQYAKDHIIFETIIGSRAYGTHNDKTSDTDLAGVMIPGSEYILGMKHFEQFRDFPGEDRILYDFRKALSLILENNPNCLDFLYAPDRCVQVMTPYWQAVVDKRDVFLSKKCRYTFSGYAIAQLHRIKTHRKFLLNPPQKPPSRIEMGLPEESIFPTSQLKAVCYAAIEAIPEENREDFLFELDQIYGDWVVPLFARFLDPKQRSLAMQWLQMGIRSQSFAFQALGTKYLKDEYMEMASKEVLYSNVQQEWDQYQQWKKSRNKKRADLEEKFGFDCKHAMHLVRLLRMGKEILSVGKVNVDRTHIDAEELKAIREGAWSYDQVETYANSMDVELGELYKTSTLPRTPNNEAVHNLCVSIIEKYYLEKLSKC